MARVAMPETKTDLWGHVQRSLLDTGPLTEAPVIPLPRPAGDPHVRVDDLDTAPAWHADANRARADAIFAELEQAAASGKRRRARRLSRAWLSVLQGDRKALAAELSRERGWRLEAIGRGTVVDRPTVLYRDRLPWVLRPSEDPNTAMPARAAAVRDRWMRERVFDAFLVADEPSGRGPIPCRSLLGVLSPDGRGAEWFILDRWGC